MKKVFMLLFALTIVIGTSAFGEHEKSPPVPTVVVAYDTNLNVVALATAEISRDITTEAENHLIIEAVIPYTEFHLVASEKQRVRWQRYSLDVTNNKIQSAKVKPTLQKNRSCLELNC